MTDDSLEFVTAEVDVADDDNLDVVLNDDEAKIVSGLIHEILRKCDSEVVMRMSRIHPTIVLRNKWIIGEIDTFGDREPTTTPLTAHQLSELANVIENLPKQDIQEIPQEKPKNIPKVDEEDTGKEEEKDVEKDQKKKPEKEQAGQSKNKN